MRAVVPIAAAIAVAASAAADVDVAAAPGERGALDRTCDVSQSANGDRVIVICPARRSSPDADTIRASLVEGFRIALIPGGPFHTGSAGPRGVVYHFIVDTGARPLRPSPIIPPAAMRAETATCAARFDLAADGSTTNLCVSCEAPVAKEAFEQSVRTAVSRWLYAPATNDADSSDRESIRIEFPFVWENPGEEPISAPPLPASACPAGEK